MKTLDEIALKYETDKSSKYHDYCKTYDPLFDPLRNEEITFLEIGVQYGLSIKTWLEYFPVAKIHGVDVIQDFKEVHPRFTFWIGDQRNRLFWQHFCGSVKALDIVIDDACHNADAQKTSFESLWSIVKPGGYYIIEDWFTVYDPSFSSPISGGDWLKQLVADLNWNGKSYYGKPTPNQPVTLFEQSLNSVTIKNGLVIIKKS